MPAKTAKKAAPAPPKAGGVTKLAKMPPTKRRRRDSWLRLINVESWEALFDGGVYRVELPALNDPAEAMTQFVRAAQAAFGYRNRARGSARQLIAERQSNTVVILNVVDK